MPTPTNSAPAQPRESTVSFSLRNWLFLAAGLLCVVAGYVTLADASTVLAPLLLVLGYVILIPLGIIL
jgi:hypothetical protein